MEKERDMTAMGRIGAMDAAVAAMKAAAALPAGVGPVPVAPARGPVKVVPVWAGQAGGTRRMEGLRAEPCDVFDRMLADARARHDRLGGDAAHVPPFSPGQVSMARDYRAMSEKRAAGGVRCSSLDGGRGGGGAEFMDAYLEDGRRLAALHARIGTGQAMVLRRVRPSVRGSRVSILDRRLVDLVCLGGLSLGQVLEAHGWANNGRHREEVRLALVAALDRMQGYGTGRAQHGA